MKNLKIVNKELTAALMAGVLAFTLVGCANTNTKEKEDIKTEKIENIASSESAESDALVEKNIENADNAVEAAIGIMVEGGEKLAEDSKEATETESYKKEKEKALDNFITLSEFLRGETEIAGYSVDEVKDETIEYAEESLYTLDEDLERIYPGYKEKLKEKGEKFLEWAEEKGTDLAAKGYDKYQELKEKTLEKSQKK